MEQVATMEPVKDRVIKITFNADVHSSLQWNFRPQQTEIFVSNLCTNDIHDMRKVMYHSTIQIKLGKPKTLKLSS